MNDDSCFNDNYERKRKKWNENMNYKYCYIQGPKGDKGDLDLKEKMVILLLE